MRVKTGKRHALGYALSSTLLLGLGTMEPAVAHGEKSHSGQAQALVKEQKPWGIAGDPEAVTRTVEVRMSDSMRFSPDHFEVRAGETVRLSIHNDGRMLHELVLGSREELDEHAALMARFPGMEHDEPYMAHVAPGEREEIVWTFNRAGRFDFACLLPGHYQAGMVGGVQVLESVASQRQPAGL